MKLVIYRTRRPIGGGYRWRLVAANGRILANGGQGYSRRIDMWAAIALVLGGSLTDDGTLLYRQSGAITVEDRT